jgi:hypothetical protein
MSESAIILGSEMVQCTLVLRPVSLRSCVYIPYHLCLSVLSEYFQSSATKIVYTVVLSASLANYLAIVTVALEWYVL